MSLSGKYTSHELKETQAGKAFAVCTLEYNDKPWESLSTFDTKIIDILQGLQSGEAIDFETKKSKDGKYQNLVAIAKAGDELVRAERGTSGGGAKSGGSTGGGYKGPQYTEAELTEIRYCNFMMHALSNPNVDPLKPTHINEIRVTCKALSKEINKEDFFK